MTVEQPEAGTQDDTGTDTSATTYTQEDLEAMTKQQIADLATSLGYTVNSNNTKAEMIESFLEQQAGGAPDQGADPDPGTGGDPSATEDTGTETGTEPDPGAQEDTGTEAG